MQPSFLTIIPQTRLGSSHNWQSTSFLFANNSPLYKNANTPRVDTFTAKQSVNFANTCQLLSGPNGTQTTYSSTTTGC